jgi:hypothetical protein
MKKHFLVFGIVAILFSACNNKSISNENSTATAEKMTHPKAPKAEGSPRILFIGSNDMIYDCYTPSFFSDICKINNQPMNFCIEGDYTRTKYDTDNIFTLKEDDGNYFDYVVLHESTPVVMSDPDKFKQNVKIISNKVFENSPNALIYIYQPMTPVNSVNCDYKKYHSILHKNTFAALKYIKNVHIFKVGDAFNDAYINQKDHHYQSYIRNKDGLKDILFEEGDQQLTDGKFLQAVLLYTSIFNKKPNIPEKLSLKRSTRLDELFLTEIVNDKISNPKSLVEIAFNNR